MVSPKKLDFSSCGGVGDCDLGDATLSRRKSPRTPSSKRTAPEVEEETKKKRQRTDEKKKKKKKKKEETKTKLSSPSSSRIWNIEEEVTILKGLVDFRAKKGVQGKIDWEEFYRLLGGSFVEKFSKDQVYSKIRTLRRKYVACMEKINQGNDPKFTRVSDLEAFGYSQMIWGRDEAPMDKEMLNELEEHGARTENETGREAHQSASGEMIFLLVSKTEAKMIEAIINDVLGELSLTQPKDSEDFIGIEAHIEKINFFLHLESEEVEMVGILGPSGIGKTTIARVLFNRLSRRFPFNVFIDRAFLSKNMEHYSGANLDDYNMKLHLQRMFVSEILGKRDIKICDLGSVGEWLKNHKVLIFIDDLKNQVVLDTLVGDTHWFGCGSRIIVMTVDKHLLKAHEIDMIYEVPLPSNAHALQILCRFAFRQNYPPDGFMELASETALRASKLPLVLKVLGSHLRGRDKKDWMDMLQMFRKGQHGKIEETLKFSYHGLNNKRDEAIFRHIACFFNGEKVDDIKSLLADSDLDVDTGIQNLVDKALIQETCNTVEMHSLLQEMGQEINRTQSSEPGKREFIVDSKDIRNVLEDNTGTENVLGISFDINETEELHIHESAFKEMRNLRYLKIDNKGKKEDRLHLSKDFNYLPPKLRLLRWENYPLRSMPTKFRPQNLVELVMRNGYLEKLWDGVEPLIMLKKMVLRGCKELKEIPDLSMATNLETLDLANCSSLEKIPSCFSYPNKLRKLDMSFCINLVSLPTNLINLQALDRLDLFGCSRLRSFPNISRSTNISYLNLSQTGIEEVPRWIENLTKLKKVSMRGCQKLQYVSLNISKLKHLKTVNFSNCGALKVASLNGLPDNVEVSSSLADDSFPRVKLNLINCYKLDQEALLQQQSLFKILILSGEEVPSYFTHRTDRTFMTHIPLLQSSLSQPFFRLMACAVVDFESSSTCLIEVHCQFIDTLGNHFGSASWPTYLSKAPLGSHLVIFNCCLPLNGDYAYLAKRHYDHVDIQFRLTDDYSQFKLKGCGIRLYEDGRN